MKHLSVLHLCPQLVRLLISAIKVRKQKDLHLFGLKFIGVRHSLSCCREQPASAQSTHEGLAASSTSLCFQDLTAFCFEKARARG